MFLWTNLSHVRLVARWSFDEAEENMFKLAVGNTIAVAHLHRRYGGRAWCAWHPGHLPQPSSLTQLDEVFSQPKSGLRIYGSPDFYLVSTCVFSMLKLLAKPSAPTHFDGSSPSLAQPWSPQYLATASAELPRNLKKELPRTIVFQKVWIYFNCTTQPSQLIRARSCIAWIWYVS